MIRAVMTILAKIGHSRFQQFEIIAAMRSMAIIAVFFHRDVLPDKRAAFFGMALIA